MVDGGTTEMTTIIYELFNPVLDIHTLYEAYICSITTTLPSVTHQPILMIILAHM